MCLTEVRSLEFRIHVFQATFSIITAEKVKIDEILNSLVYLVNVIMCCCRCQTKNIYQIFLQHYEYFNNCVCLYLNDKVAADTKIIQYLCKTMKFQMTPNIAVAISKYFSCCCSFTDYFHPQICFYPYEYDGVT